MKRTFFAAAVLLTGFSLALQAQTQTPSPSPTPTPTPGPPIVVATGETFTTDGNARVNGVRLKHEENGDLWFLESSADRVSVKRGTTITSWQLRPDDELGANPVDFELDGDTVWIVQSGQSQIPAGFCALSNLDTTTGVLTEYVIPGSIPAGYWKAPDGTYWLAQSGAALQNVNLETRQVTTYRSQFTSSYADIVLGPDGALWMADFGNNRIVRYVPGATTETYWLMLDPNQFRLLPAQIDFDDQGNLWIAEVGADRMDRFNPTTGVLSSYYGISNPIHFEIFQKNLYVTSSTGGASSVSVLDPAVAPPTNQTLNPVTAEVRSSPNLVPVTIRTSTLLPETFESTRAAMPADTLDISGGPGIVTTLLDSVGTYGVTVAGGYVWVGTNGKLVNVVLQAIGTPTDQTVPVATSLSGAPDNEIRVELTLSNPTSGTLAGDALYLYSPGGFPVRTPFTLAPGATEVLIDAFANVGNGALLNGPVRLRVTTGDPADLLASVRSARIRPGGGTFGYSLEAAAPAASLGPGTLATLFTGARPAAEEVSVLGLYTASDEARGLLTLVAPDGTVRGLRPFHLAKNTTLEFNPAASAFGVDAEPGDVVRVEVETGTLQPYVNVVDLGTLDVAAFVPVFATSDSVVPNAGSVVGASGTQYLTDLFLSNPDPDTAAEVSVAFYPLLSTADPLVATVALPPGTSQAIQDFLPTLFGISSGQGAVLLTANVPVAAAARIAASYTFGDYAGFAPSIDGASGIDGGSAIAFGLPQTSSMRTNLMLYNRGVAGTITVTAFNAAGAQAGALGLEIGDHVATRLNSVFAAFGLTNQPGGRIRIDVPAGMNVYAWTAAVSSVSDVDLAAPR